MCNRLQFITAVLGAVREYHALAIRYVIRSRWWNCSCGAGYDSTQRTRLWKHWLLAHLSKINAYRVPLEGHALTCYKSLLQTFLLQSSVIYLTSSMRSISMHFITFFTPCITKPFICLYMCGTIDIITSKQLATNPPVSCSQLYFFNTLN